MRIYSIFNSVNGEVNKHGIGSMTTFIRFAGCSTACPFCDTEYAKSKDSGQEMSVGDILNRLRELSATRVTITGGEPLEQRDDLEKLLSTLHRFGYPVTVETNGQHLFNKDAWVYSTANWVVDIKMFDAFPVERYARMNLERDDYIKMVIGSMDEFYLAVSIKNELQKMKCRATFAFSPMYGQITPNILLQAMMKTHQTDAVLNVQLHKICSLEEAN